MTILKVDIDEKKLFRSALQGKQGQVFEELQLAKMRLESLERQLIKQLYPEFDWMYQTVTYEWRCENSPVGHCVYDMIEDPAHDECLHCGQPEERK